jgi:hypothetical protein
MTDISVNELDMVYNTSGGKTVAGGYLVNSILLNEGVSAYGIKEGGRKETDVVHNKVSDRFKHLAVPAGLLYINDRMKDTSVALNEPYKSAVINDAVINDAVINDAVINDDLYEKLLKLAQPPGEERSIIKPKKMTKKHVVKTNNKKNKKKTKGRAR